jgi:hypothetical protein
VIRVLRVTGSLVAVLAVGGLFAFGSHTIRLVKPQVAVVSPSPTFDPCNQPGVIGGGSCIPAGLPAPSPTGPACASTDPTLCQPPCDPVQWPGQCTTPNGGTTAVTPIPEPSAGSVAPAGKIEAAVTTFIIPRGANGTGGKIGVFIAVLYQGQYVPGASLSFVCSGPGVNLSLSGTTADRSSWAPTSDPSIPSGPSAFYWGVAAGDFQQGAAYPCHGSATFNGLSTGF